MTASRISTPRAPVEATLDEASNTWSAPVGELSVGEHTIHARAQRDTTYAEVVSATFTVEPGAVVDWQVTRRNSQPAAAGWQSADGFATWTFSFDTRDFGAGRHTLGVRVAAQGVELARQTVAMSFAR